MIAHRGGGSVAPENTLAGLSEAVRAGFGAVEFDVMLAADGVPLLMHDEVLGRTVSGQGRVAQMDSSSLQALDAGSWKGPEFAGEPVPLYRQALMFCLASGLWMNVELKPAAGHEAQTGETVARLTKEWLGDDAGGRVLFSSFSLTALQAARAAAPAIPRGWLLDTLPDRWQQTLQDLGAASLHLHHSLASATVVAQAHALSCGVFCYTVNTPVELRRLSALGVDAICTDRIDLFAPDAFPVFPA
jgi:glycerophosphoryl diester phosphodiesterase